MPELPDAIVTEGLTKSYGKRRVVADLNLRIARGEIYGFLGPNGAGKSTTIRMLLGLVAPTAGEARVAGYSVQRQRGEALRRVGAIVDQPCFYDTLTARKNLELAQRLHGPLDEDRIDELLALVRLSDRGDESVGTFSHGMQQRLGIARSLLHRPEVVILDEPADGLDPRGRIELRDLIREVSGRYRVTVLLSSHLLDEMEVLCDRVGIIHRGVLLYQGDVAGLRPSRGARLRLVVGPADRARQVLGSLPAVASVGDSDGGALAVELQPGADPAALPPALLGAGLSLSELSPVRERLETIFLRLTAEQADAAA